MKKEVLFCDCNSSEDCIVISSFPEDPNDNLLYVEVGIVQRKGLLGKLKFIFNYLLANNNNSLYFVEVLLNKEAQQQLVNVVQNNLDLQKP